MKKTIAFIWLITSLLATAGTVTANENEFPHRARFKDVPVVEISELKNRLTNVVIVDVRSKYEFDTLHIKGAINIPLASVDFAARIQALSKNSGKKIVMYCNGGTCKKSYKAVHKAKQAGVSNCVAFDGGIYKWARTHPAHSVLLGQSPMQPDAFIDNKRFKVRMLSAAEFESRLGPRAQILDIRDRAQRDTQLFPFREKRVQLDEMDRIKQIVTQSKRSNKTLLVYDKVGKQVRWFQYFLEREGVRNYYFMKGGSEGYYEAKLGNFRIKVPEKS
jgi:rhodanese-related sulfurtransferase